MNSRHFSVPRRHLLAALLWMSAGVASTFWFWPEHSGTTGSEWQSVGSMLASVSSTMVGLTIAAIALLFALLSTPAVQFIHRKGLLNRLVFDLMVCAALWTVAVVLGMIGTLPSSASGTAPDVLRFGFSAAVAGTFCFVPIGSTLWLLLSNSSATPALEHRHDFDKPTQLDLPTDPGKP